MYIIIPSYEPDRRLVDLVSDISRQMSDTIIVVDDGSGKSYKQYFEAVANLGAVLLTHDKNRGKGAALKTAFSYVQENVDREEIMITIDSDGQHLITDMIKVAESTKEHPQSIILGSRAFVGKVPARSLFGNKLTALLFKLVTSQKVRDTQTGLRAMSTHLVPWLLQLDGQRFEYEFNMLLEAEKNGYQIHEVPIETIYLEENRGSHFRPIRDSIRIYSPFLKFSGTAILAAAIDAGALFILLALSDNLLLSVVLARVLSATTQGLLNANLVFRKKKSILVSMLRYFSLVVVILACNYLMLKALVSIGLGLVIAKLLTEGVLFLLSYRVQQRIVFA